jgi:hypothetical protein
MKHDRIVRCAKILPVALIIAFLPGCADGLGDPTGSTCPSNSTLTYENFGRAFIGGHCGPCHAGQASPRLTSQADVQANIDIIDRAAASGPDAANTFMPEEGSVSDADRKKLGEWLACGAP